MADVNVTIGGNAGGARAACAEAKAAIAGVTGKTVYIDIVTRHLGGAASDMGKVGDAASRASDATRDMSGHTREASEHMGRMADAAEKYRTHMAAVDNIMRGGASGVDSHAEGMRRLGGEADRVNRSMGALGSSRALGDLESGASGAGRSMRELGAGTESAHQATRRAITSGNEAGSSFRTASGHVSQMGSEMVRASHGALEMSKGVDGVYRTIDAIGHIVPTGGGGGGILSGWSGVLDGVGGAAGAASGAIRAVGLATIYSAAGMGILAGAVSAVGLGGVAEDFMHDSQMMHQGEQAVRGFNKAFSAMRSETSAAGLPMMGALAAQAKQVGHELASIGVANMAPVLGDVTKLGGSATQAMRQLAPAIPPALNALTALGGAALGALGNSGPEIARFSNAITDNAGGIQQFTEGAIKGMSVLGTAAVQTAAAVAPAVQFAGDAMGFAADAAGGLFGQQSNEIAQPGPDGSTPGGSSWVNRMVSGASKGAILGGAVGLLGGPAAEITGPVGGLIGGIVGGAAGLAGAPGFAPVAPGTAATTGSSSPPISQKELFGGRAGGGSPESAWAKGMTGADVYSKSMRDAGIDSSTGRPLSGQLGGQPIHAGFGSGTQVISPSQAAGLGAAPEAPAFQGLISGAAQGGAAVHAVQAPPPAGMAAIPQAFQDMMGAAAGAVAQAPMAAAGQQAVKHLTKSVESGSSEVASAGAGLGGSAGGGVAAGITSTQSVTDTVIRRHMKHLIDVGADALGAHSPAREFHPLGQSIPWGVEGGIQAEHHRAVEAAVRMVQHAHSEASSYDAERAAQPLRISVRRKTPEGDVGDNQTPTTADQAGWRQSLGTSQSDYKPGSADWWGAHDNRAAELAQSRSDLHEKALANAGVSGHTDPFKANVDPFAQAGQDGRSALESAVNPLSRLTGSMQAVGQDIAGGIGAGVQRNAAAVANPLSRLSGSMLGGFKKDLGISSPSAVFAGCGGEVPAGVGVGVSAGASDAVTAVGDMSNSMQAAGDRLSDRGLMVGYTWSENILTGAAQQLKKADFTSAGLPQLQAAAMRQLAGTGLLQAGSGASVWKTFGNSASTVTLTVDSTPTAPQTIVIQPQHIYLDGEHVATIADQRFEVLLGKLTTARNVMGR